MTTGDQGRLVPFAAAHLPIVRPWFDDPDARRWLGGPDWPEMMLRLTDSFRPGVEFRGQIVLLQRSFVLVDADGQPVALVTGELYDRRTNYAGDGPDGPVFVDEPGHHRPTAGVAVVVDPQRRREGWGARAVAAYMMHPDLAAAECVVVGIEPDNTARRRLFERLGFTVERETPDWEDMLEYRKLIAQSEAAPHRDIPGRSAEARRP